MKKKLFLLFVLPLVMCGCTSTVNLRVTNDSVTESITINGIDGTTIRKNMPCYYDDPVPDELDPDVKEDGVEYYNNVFDSNSSTYSYKFKLEDYKKSAALNRAFGEYYVNVENSEVSFEFNNLVAMGDYDELDTVTFNITSDVDVLSNNADEVNDNVYTWYFNRGNYNNKSISFKYKIDKNATSKVDEEEVDNTINEIITIVVICVLTIGVTYSILKILNANNLK